jgi:UDP-galactopyranose mutase
MKKTLIIGGGFAGCAAAHQFARLGGWDVTLVEHSDRLGAGVRTHFYGGHPYTFGPRHFLTQNEEVYAYLDSIVPLRRCQEHEFVTYVERDAAFYSYPIHRADIALMPNRDSIETEMTRLTGLEHARNFEEYWVSSVGRTLYEKFIKTYSEKMWMVDDNRSIDYFSWSPKGATLADGPKAAWGTALSAYPVALDGYNAYFDIATAEAKVLLNTRIERFDLPNRRVMLGGEWQQYDLIVNTISPDLVLDEAHGALGYIGRDFHKIVLPIEHCFPENTYFVYYANDERFTRLVEYKKLTRYQSSSTLIGMEIPSANGRYYPLPFKSEAARAKRYFSMMPEGVFSMGRAGSYLYAVDIDDCLEQALNLAIMVQEGGQDGPVPTCYATERYKVDLDATA